MGRTFKIHKKQTETRANTAVTTQLYYYIQRHVSIASKIKVPV